MALLFCKIYDELDKAPDEVPEFRVGFSETAAAVAKRIKGIFKDVKQRYSDVFGSSDTIKLDSKCIRFVVGTLQRLEVTGASRDAVGEAFEVFVGPAVRGEEGQFFTPRNVVQMMIDILNPRADERLLDPACGSGGFLVVALEKIWSDLEAEATRKKWRPSLLERRKLDAANKAICGMDKDAFLTKLTKAYMAIIAVPHSWSAGSCCDF